MKLFKGLYTIGQPFFSSFFFYEYRGGGGGVTTQFQNEIGQTLDTGGKFNTHI